MAEVEALLVEAQFNYDQMMGNEEQKEESGMKEDMQTEPTKIEKGWFGVIDFDFIIFDLLKMEGKLPSLTHAFLPSNFAPLNNSKCAVYIVHWQYILLLNFLSQSILSFWSAVAR